NLRSDSFRKRSKSECGHLRELLGLPSWQRPLSVHRICKAIMRECLRVLTELFWRIVLVSRLAYIWASNDQLTDGGPSVSPELSTGVAGPPFGAAHGSARFVNLLCSSYSHSSPLT